MTDKIQPCTTAHELDLGDKVALVTGRVGTVEDYHTPWATLSCGCCSEPMPDDYHTVDVIWDDDGSETNEDIGDLYLLY